MPPRSVCLVILLYWVVASSSLIRRDVLPELGFVRPPDLRAIAQADERTGPTRWSVEVIDNPLTPEVRRPIGQAVTEVARRLDGWVTLSSRIWFDAGGLLRGTSFSNREAVQLEVRSESRVDPSGNLHSFRMNVKDLSSPDELVHVEGDLINREMHVKATGPLPILNQTRVIPYEPRGLMQNSLSPFDRLPGLQVGQRWETRMVSPLTGRIESVRAEVVRRLPIHWDKAPVQAFEVVHQMTPLASRTWVRPDGLVLRQEVPFPFVKLILERLPDRETLPNAEVPGR